MAELQTLYLPVLQSESRGRSILADYVDVALASGPIYGLVVHETEHWQAVAEQEYFRDIVRVIPTTTVREMERRAAEYVGPVEEALPAVVDLEDGTRTARENILRPLRHPLVALQVGTRYKCAISTDWDVFIDSRNMIKGLLASPGVDEHPEIRPRLAALDEVIAAYALVDVEGLAPTQAIKNLQEKMQILDDGLTKALSSSKWELALHDSPLSSKRKGIANRASEVVLKWGGRLSIGGELVNMVLDGAAPGFLSAAGIVSSIIPPLELAAFTPVHIHDSVATFMPTEGAVAASFYGMEYTMLVEK